MPIFLERQREKDLKYPLRFIDQKGKGDNTGEGLNYEQYGVL
jgi:hypothetical protein